MFSHIQLGVRDLTRMQQFYDSVLAELGLVRVAEERVGEAGVIWRRADRRWPQFVLRAPLNGLPATWANGSQISFADPRRMRRRRHGRWRLPSALSMRVSRGYGRSMRRISTAPTAAIPEGNKLCFVYADGVNG